MLRRFSTRSFWTVTVSFVCTRVMVYGPSLSVSALEKSASSRLTNSPKHNHAPLVWISLALFSCILASFLSRMSCESAWCWMLKIMSLLNTNCPGVAFSVVWCVLRTAQHTALTIPAKGSSSFLQCCSCQLLASCYQWNHGFARLRWQWSCY